MAYISKKQQVLNILADLQATITSRNVDIGINILNWAKEKIILAEKENKRQYYLQKFPTDTRNKPRVVKYGRVYGCNLGKNVGSEQNGKSRPVIVLQKDSPNSAEIVAQAKAGREGLELNFRFRLSIASVVISLLVSAALKLLG